MDESVFYDEDTMAKVYEGLMDSGLSFNHAREAVRCMQNRGLLFRERARD